VWVEGGGMDRHGTGGHRKQNKQIWSASPSGFVRAA